GVEVVGDVQHERRLRVQAEVDAEVVDDALGVKRLAGQVGLGEFAPEAGGVHQSAGGDVVGVGGFPVGGGEATRPQLPQGPGQSAAGVEVGDEAAVGQAEVAAPVEAEDCGGRIGFATADLGAAVRRRLAVGQVEDADAGALGPEQEDGAAGAEFGVVGVGGD